MTGYNEEKDQLSGRLVTAEEELEEMRAKYQDAETQAIDYEQKWEAMNKELRLLRNQNKAKETEMKDLRQENQELGKKAIMMERLEG